MSFRAHHSDDPRKKRRLDNNTPYISNVFSTLAGETDDYLPSSTSSKTKPKPVVQPPAQPKKVDTPEVPKPICEYEKFILNNLKGEDEEFKPIFQDLKSHILFYNCSDRVLKALKYLRARDESLMTQKIISQVRNTAK